MPAFTPHALSFSLFYYSLLTAILASLLWISVFLKFQQTYFPWKYESVRDYCKNDESRTKTWRNSLEDKYVFAPLQVRIISGPWSCRYLKCVPAANKLFLIFHRIDSCWGTHFEVKSCTVHSRGWRGRCKRSTLDLVPSLRMSGAVNPFPYLSSQRARGKLYLCLFNKWNREADGIHSAENKSFIDKSKDKR